MTTKTKAKSATKAAAPVARPATKIAKVIALLERDGGATLVELTKATGWQPHSARAALTGLRKKGLTILKSKRNEETCYRITGHAS